MTIDYTRNEIDILIDLIRDDNSRKTLTTGQVTFGSPSEFAPIEGVDRNTVIIATAISGRGYTGSQPFYYNRLPLSAFVPTGDPEVLTFQKGDRVKLSELLPEINARFKINLTADKIVDANLPDISEIDADDIQLAMQPNSLVYTDTLMLRIENDLTPLSEVITKPDLDGLEYEPPQLPLVEAISITDLNGFTAEL